MYLTSNLILYVLVIHSSKNKCTQMRYTHVWIFAPISCVVFVHMSESWLYLTVLWLLSTLNLLLLCLSNWRNYSKSDTWMVFMGSQGNSGWTGDLKQCLSLSPPSSLKEAQVGIRLSCSRLGIKYGFEFPGLETCTAFFGSLFYCSTVVASLYPE